MSSVPDTRQSLLINIQDPSNRVAWHEFCSLYRPVVYRIARHRGLQHADADDLVQHVLMSVMKSIPQWDSSRTSRFRSWLATVSRNAIIDALRRHKPDQATGRTSVIQQLRELPDNACTEEEINLQVRRQLFRRAADEIELEFEPETWSAFRRTTIQRQSVVEVANDLDKSIGAIYAARGRVMKRLKEKVSELMADET